MVKRGGGAPAGRVRFFGVPLASGSLPRRQCGGGRSGGRNGRVVGGVGGLGMVDFSRIAHGRH